MAHPRKQEFGGSSTSWVFSLVREPWDILGSRSSGDHVYRGGSILDENRGSSCEMYFVLRLLSRRNADDQARRQRAPHRN